MDSTKFIYASSTLYLFCMFSSTVQFENMIIVYYTNYAIYTKAPVNNNTLTLNVYNNRIVKDYLGDTFCFFVYGRLFNW
jgi:hypothetical protein